MKTAAWMECRPVGYEFVLLFENPREARSYARRAGYRILKIGESR